MGKNKTTLVAEPGKQEVIVTREFDAPPEMVFRLSMDPKSIPKWWGPEQYETRVERLEARDGGQWRFLQKDSSGQEFGFHGVYHEVLPSKRIIQTFEYEGLPEKGHVILETTRFEELPGKRTKITVINTFQSLADRDGMVATGMESGLTESYERLDKLLDEQKNKV